MLNLDSGGVDGLSFSEVSDGTIALHKLARCYIEANVYKQLENGTET